MSRAPAPVSAILFVCTANICRSPTALGVFGSLLAARGAASHFELDSAGTHEYRVGEAPSPLAIECARRRGYEISRSVARRLSAGDLERFDHILAMDRANLACLGAIAPTSARHKIELLLEYGESFRGADVPDPYGRSPRDYELALDMIEDGCRGLARTLLRDYARDSTWVRK